MSSLCCLDTSGLLALEQSPTRSTRWVLLAQPPPAPAVASPSAAHRDDEAREELEEGAAEEFADEVGGDVRSAELRAWRVAYIRRRLTCVVRGAQSALTGTAPAANTDDARVATRKKDAPDHSNRAQVDKFMKAQAQQASLARARSGNGRTGTLIASASKPLPGKRRVWEAPSSSEGYRYALSDNAPQPLAPRKRAVVDDLASASECRHARGASLLAMDGLADPDSPAYNGELTLVASPPELLAPQLAEGGVRLVRLLLWRIANAVRTCFGEDRPLYLSGALLTRLQPPPPAHRAAQGESYKYDVAHVDRANVASYDYSAVLYLNTYGDDFEGGEFRFVDGKSDEVVQPRAGRCVLFPSGYEHLHRVCRVTKGSRYALAAWLTLSEQAAEAPLEPAHYAMHEPVPPPSREDREADKIRLEDLKARLIAAGGCSG